MKTIALGIADCPNCKNSKNVIRKGKYKNKTKLHCKQCGKYFFDHYCTKTERSSIASSNAKQGSHAVDEWTHQRIAQLREQGLSYEIIALRLGLHRSTVWGHLRQQGLIKSRESIEFAIISPEGVEHTFTDVKAFALEHGLNPKSLRDFLTNRSWKASCKRWVCYKGWRLPNEKPLEPHPWRIIFWDWLKC